MLKIATLIALALALAAPAFAAGWSAPAYTVRLNSFATSDAFPGSLNSGPDEGLQPMAEIQSARRFLRTYKLGFTASAGGTLQNQFTRGNYGWLGLAGTLRRDRATFTLEGRWTPRRNKFPTDPEEGGQFAGTQITAGYRRAVGARGRLRLEGTFDRDDFVPQVADRNTRGREAYGSYVLAPSAGVELRAEGSYSYDDVRANKWDKNERWTGVGVAWTRSTWHPDLGLRSGASRYDHAIAGQSNFQRRDQWIELRFRVTRSVAPGLAVSLGGNLQNQTSSRPDRAFNANTLTLGLEWNGGGK